VNISEAKAAGWSGEDAEEFAAWHTAVEKGFLDEIGVDVDSVLGDWMSADLFTSGHTVDEAVGHLLAEAADEWGEDIMFI
jgi:hypothetical protein